MSDLAGPPQFAVLKGFQNSKVLQDIDCLIQLLLQTYNLGGLQKSQSPLGHQMSNLAGPSDS